MRRSKQVAYRDRLTVKEVLHEARDNPYVYQFIRGKADGPIQSD